MENMKQKAIWARDRIFIWTRNIILLFLFTLWQTDKQWQALIALIKKHLWLNQYILHFIESITKHITNIESQQHIMSILKQEGEQTQPNQMVGEKGGYITTS